MIILQARPTLVVATIVWALWRLVLWRGRGAASAARELVVAATFLWSLVIVRVTFFPLTIIFYDWHGASNLIPFASIIQLIRETPAVFAFENILGNLVLFAPLGVLLPLLFDRLERPVAMFWRASALSLLIEGTHLLTRARSVDIDDVILNTTGAMIGLAVYLGLSALADRGPIGRRAIEGLDRNVLGEPLLAAAVPFLMTLAITVPMMISAVVGETLGNGPEGIDARALTDLPEGNIVATNDVEDRTFVIVAADTATGTVLSRSDFKRVLPGRYTWLGGSGIVDSGSGSTYRSSVTTFNPSAGEQPTLVVWGTNTDNATSIRVTGNGVDATLPIEPGSHFVLGVEFEYEQTVEIIDDFEYLFLDSDGSPIPGFRRADSYSIGFG